MSYTYCPQCGTRQNPNNRFCPQCGTRFSATVTPQPPLAQPVKKREQKKKSTLRHWLEIILALFVKMPLIMVMSVLMGGVIIVGLTFGVGSITTSIFGEDIGLIVGIILFPVSVALYLIVLASIGDSGWIDKFMGGED